jgi:hypothetical protein
LDKYLCFSDKARIAHEILAYLTDHPDAQDTLEGVVEWWLLERKIKYHMALVRDVLSGLVAKGFLLESRKGDERNKRYHYRINKDKKKQIQIFLKEGGTVPGE